MKLCVSCSGAFASDEWTCPHCGSQPLFVDGAPLFAPELAECGEGFDPHIFATLAALEPESFWFRARNRLIVWAVAEYFPAARTLLEVGCGTGFVLAGLAHSRPQLALAGSELFVEALPFARSRAPGASLMQLDARRLPFEDEWDVIGSFDVLEHIEDDGAALASMLNALRPGGGLIVTVPQHRALWSAADDYAHHVRRYTRAGLRRELQRAGFEVVRMTSFVTLLLPAMATQRVLARVRSNDSYNPVREHRLGRLGAGLERVLDAERGLIARGWSLPAGGSLLAVAVRPG
jgi:SAM-dependent methyltransferase